jgi:hypothetical protein
MGGYLHNEFFALSFSVFSLVKAHNLYWYVVNSVLHILVISVPKSDQFVSHTEK